MTPTPATPPLDPRQPPIGKPRSNTLAGSVLILAILSYPFLIAAVGNAVKPGSAFEFAFGLGSLLAILTLIHGSITLSLIGTNPTQYGGRGMAITGISAGGAALVLAVLILLPSLGKSREIHGSTCAANLRGIMQAIVVYSGDNADAYPYLGPAAISAQPALKDTGGGLMHDMFYLVGTGCVAPKQFICKSDPAGVAPSSSPVSAGGKNPPYSPAYWTHPSGGDPNFCYSYSFAFQYAAPTQLGRWWCNTMDAGLPIAADMNPGNQTLPGKSIRNSLNHFGDGQTVAFADGHAEFSRTPTCGEINDHIYNLGPHQPPASPGIGGLPFPADPSGNTPGTFDTCLQPLLTNATSYTRI